MKSILSFLMLHIIVVFSSYGQDVILLDGLTSNYISCDGFVTDAGFTIANYENDSDFFVTVCSDNGEGLQVDFNSFEIEDRVDFLSVYDGPNDFGCTDTICQVIKVDGDLIVHVPSACTPDDDLVNDSWAPVIIGAFKDEYQLKIYGRNGQIIWQSNDINERWIGQGADDQNYYAGDSVYQWQSDVRRLGSVDKRTYRGIVTLVR